MSWLRPYIAVLTVYCMIPGAGEVIENVMHLVESGHAAHAIDDADHERDGSEHGCSGTSHVCSCCQTPAFLRTDLVTSVARSQPAQHNQAIALDDFEADGFLSSVFRPPIA